MEKFKITAHFLHRIGVRNEAEYGGLTNVTTEGYPGAVLTSMGFHFEDEGRKVIVPYSNILYITCHDIERD